MTIIQTDTIQTMKKKEDKPEGLNLQFLDKKHQEEKQILNKQIRRLEQQLNSQIERANNVAKKYDQQAQKLKDKNQELMRSNQQLIAQRLNMERQVEPSFDEEEQTQYLRQHRQLMSQNRELQQEKAELEQILEKIYQQKEELAQSLRQFQKNDKELQAAMDVLEDKHEQYKRQSQMKIHELEEDIRRIVDDKDKQVQKLTEQKKRKKDLEKKANELGKKMEGIIQDENRLRIELESTKAERDREHERYNEISTKYALSQAKIANQEKYISKIEEDLQLAQKNLSHERQQTDSLHHKMEKIAIELRNTEQDNERLKQEFRRLQGQFEKSTISKEQIIRAMRRNETQELIGIIKHGAGDISNKNLQKIVQSQYNNKGTSSQSQLPSMNRPFVQQFQTDDRVIERTKYEMMINNLEGELANCRKQLEDLNYDLSRSKRANQDKSLEMQRKQSEIRQLRLRLDKTESDRSKQLMTLRNENQLVKCRQTEHLQRAREFEDYKTAIALKLAFYESKIKGHLDTIDRKQTIIEKLQLHKNENEDKQKFYEDHIRKLGEQVDFLRKFKQDCTRKDELMKDYKSKLEKSKLQADQSKNQLANLKRQRHHLNKQIESKDQYIASLKSRFQKQQKQQSKHHAKDEEQKENRKMQELKNGYENKLNHLRKQKQHLSHSLRQIRDLVISKVEEQLAKKIPKRKKKQQLPEYEAANLLGIKPGQLQQFLNPDCSVNRKIAKQLEELWLEGSYSQFVAEFVHFIENSKRQP